MPPSIRHTAPPDAATGFSGRRPARSIRVLIADDHQLLRETLRMLLDANDDVEVVGEAEDGRQAIDLAELLKPDVVLMDTAMPGLNGIEATATIRRRLPRTRVLMLSGHGQEDRVAAALRAGASGYVVKNSPTSELLQAIREVSQSNTYLSPQLAARTEDRDHSSITDAAGKEVSITAREREVLQLVAEGYTNRGIAERLFISMKTVEAHKEHITKKLGVRGNAELIHYAIRKGLIYVDTDADLGLSSAQEG